MKRKKKGIESLKRQYGRCFVLHWEIGVLLFFVFPLISSIIYSFSEMTIQVGSVDTQWAGLKYYHYILFEDANYLKNLRDSLIDISYSLPIILTLSLVLAIVLNSRFRGRLLMRAIFFLPVIIATGVVMDLMRSETISVPLFATVNDIENQSGGLVDFGNILKQLSLPNEIEEIFLKFFGNIFNLIWSCGIQTVLFIAGLQTIPRALYEVSRVEGANAWEEFWFITFPMISRVTLIVLVFTMIELFTAVDNKVMSQAYVVMVDNQIYDRSSAMLWFYFLVAGLMMALILGVYYRFCLKRWER